MPKRQLAYRWTVEKASTEFKIDRRTLTKRIRTSGIEPGKDGRFSTWEVAAAIFGDLAGERTREVRAKANLLEIELAKERSELIPAQDVYELLEGCFIAIRSRITYSHLSDGEKDDLLLQLHALRDHDLCKLGREALLAEFRAGTVAAAG